MEAPANFGGDVYPGGFVQAVHAMYPQFAERSSQTGGLMQHDADEFLTSTLSSVGRDVSEKIFGITFEETLQLKDTNGGANESGEKPQISENKVSKLMCNIQGGVAGANKVDYLHQGIALGLEGDKEKNSPSLGRNAVYKSTLRIKDLPNIICVQYVRFFWKKTPNSRDHTGVKCKSLRKVKFDLTLDVTKFCTDEIAKVLRKRRLENDKNRDEKKKAKTVDDEDEEEDDDLKAALQMSMEVEGMEVEKTTKVEEALTHKGLERVPKHFTGNYELISVITHKGRSSDSGHYINYSKNRTGEYGAKGKIEKVEGGKTKGKSKASSETWLKYDDDEVSLVDGDHIKTLCGGGDREMVYLAFYRALKE